MTSLSSKEKVLKIFSVATTMLRPKVICLETDMVREKISGILKSLRSEALVTMTEKGAYTLTESGIKHCRSLGFSVHESAYVRATRYDETPPHMVPQKPIKDQQVRTPSTKPNNAPADDMVATLLQKGRPIGEVFEGIQLSDTGSVLLFRLLQSLTEDHLYGAGFSVKDIDEFGDVYRSVKYRVMDVESEKVKA